MFTYTKKKKLINIFSFKEIEEKNKIILQKVLSEFEDVYAKLVEFKPSERPHNSYGYSYDFKINVKIKVPFQTKENIEDTYAKAKFLNVGLRNGCEDKCIFNREVLQVFFDECEHENSIKARYVSDNCYAIYTKKTSNEDIQNIFTKQFVYDDFFAEYDPFDFDFDTMNACEIHPLIEKKPLEMLKIVARYLRDLPICSNPKTFKIKFFEAMATIQNDLNNVIETLEQFQKNPSELNKSILNQCLAIFQHQMDTEEEIPEPLYDYKLTIENSENILEEPLRIWQFINKAIANANDDIFESNEKLQEFFGNIHCQLISLDPLDFVNAGQDSCPNDEDYAKFLLNM